jgi:PAS domain S-box-containing protein
MNWIEFVWAVILGIALALGLTHLGSALRRASVKTNLLSASVSFFLMAYTCSEWWLYKASTTMEYLHRLRVLDFAGSGALIALTVFVWQYFGTGRKWLLLAGIGVMSFFLLAFDLGATPKLVFLELAGITRVRTFGGAVFPLADGVSNPWNTAFHLGAYLLVFFVIDASVAYWRRGGGARAFVMGGTIVCIQLLSITQAHLIDSGILKSPYFISTNWLLILGIMAWELSNDQLRASRLSRDLHESQERMELAANATNAGFWEWNVDQDKIRITESGRPGIDAGKSEQIGLDRFFQTVHPEDIAKIRRWFEHSEDRPGDIEVQFRLLSAKGIRWIEARGRGEFDGPGQARRLRGTALDITERKQTEDTLRSTEQLVDALLKASNDIVHVIDEDGKILDLNDAMAESLGGTREELIGTCVFDRFARDMAEGKRDFVKRVLSESKPLRIEDVGGRSGRLYESHLYPIAADKGEKRKLAVFARDITERKRAEEALRLSEARFRDTFAQAAVGIAHVSLDGRYLRVNRKYCDIVGYSQGEMLERKFRDITYTDDLQADVEAKDRLLKGEIATYTVEKRYIRKDGILVWVSLTVSLMRNELGEPERFVAIVHDITQRKEAEANARWLLACRDMASEVLFALGGPEDWEETIRGVLPIMRAGIRADAAGIRLRDGDDFPYRCHEGFPEDFLIKENSLLGPDRNCSMCRNPDGSLSLECICGLVISGKAFHDSPLFTRGGSFWTNDSSKLLELPPHQIPATNLRGECIRQGYASLSLVPIRAKGMIVGLVQLNKREKEHFTLEMVEILEGIANNIGEAILRKQTEEMLRERETKLREAQRIAHVGNWELNHRTGALIWSDEVFRIFEIDPERFDASYEAFFAAVHPDDREKVDIAFKQSVENRAAYDINHRILIPDGRVKYVREQCNTSYDSDGKPLRSAGIVQDITENQKAAIERTQLHSELAHLNRIMSMNELSGSLAHEINQPLGAILNNASAARNMVSRLGDDHMELDQILEDIVRDSMRAGQIVRRIRGIVRKEDAKFAPLNLNALIEDVVKLYRNTLNMENTSVFLDLQPDLPLVNGDRVHLQQVLMNLVSNANEAMRMSPARALRILSTASPPDLVTISICDSGKGIASAIKDKIFQPFFTTSRDGLGIGLRICKSIIEGHDGRIWAENNPAGGATFSFSLKTCQGDSE